MWRIHLEILNKQNLERFVRYFNFSWFFGQVCDKSGILMVSCNWQGGKDFFF